MRGLVPIGWDVERLIIVEHFQDHIGRWTCHDRRSDDLVHGFVVAWMRGVMDKARTTGVYICGDR